MSTMVGEHIGNHVNIVDASNECNKEISSLKEEDKVKKKQELLAEWKNLLNSKWYL